jgi:hypothetical protein
MDYCREVEGQACEEVSESKKEVRIWIRTGCGETTSSSQTDPPTATTVISEDEDEDGHN